MSDTTTTQPDSALVEAWKAKYRAEEALLATKTVTISFFVKQVLGFHINDYNGRDPFSVVEVTITPAFIYSIIHRLAELPGLPLDTRAKGDEFWRAIRDGFLDKPEF